MKNTSQKPTIIHRISLFGLLLLVLPNLLFSQTDLSALWLKNSDGEQWDYLSDMKMDQQDNLLYAINFQGAFNFGQTQIKAINNSSRALLIKTDKEGNQLWSKIINEEGYCFLAGIETDKQSNVYAYGLFDTGFKNSGENYQSPLHNSFFIAKYNSEGEQQWLQTIEGNFLNNQLKVLASKDKLMLALSFEQQINSSDFSVKGNSFSDIALIVLNKEGQYLDHRIISGKGDETIGDIAANNSGEIFLYGSYLKSLLFQGQEINSMGKSDVFLIKIDKNLNPLLIKSMGGYGEDIAANILLEENNKMTISATFSGNFQYDNQNIVQSEIAKSLLCLTLDSNLKILHQNQLDCQGELFLNSLAKNSVGDLYLCGNYRGKIKIQDYEIESQGDSKDMFIVKFKEDGEFRFLESYGSEKFDYASKLLINKQNELILSSNIGEKVAINNLETKSKTTDEEILIAKLFDCDFGRRIALPQDTIVQANEFLLIADSTFQNYQWDDLKGTNTLLATTSDIYFLSVEDEHFCLSEDSINITLQEIEENFDLQTLFASVDENNIGEEGDFTVRVFPNPVKDIVNLDFRNANPKHQIDVMILSGQGKLIQRTSFLSDHDDFQRKMDLSSLAAGEYVLVVRDGVNLIYSVIVKLEK